MVVLFRQRRVANRCLEPCVAKPLLADCTRDRGWEALVECQIEQTLTVAQLPKQARKRGCCVDRLGLPLREILRQSVQHRRVRIVAFTDERFGWLVTEDETMA